jgi:hypothetical protein
MTDRTCGTCQHLGRDDANAAVMFCRRNPPVVIVIRDPLTVEQARSTYLGSEQELFKIVRRH